MRVGQELAVHSCCKIASRPSAKSHCRGLRSAETWIASALNSQTQTARLFRLTGQKSRETFFFASRPRAKSDCWALRSAETWIASALNSQTQMARLFRLTAQKSKAPYCSEVSR